MYKKSSFLDDFKLPEITHEAIKNELVKLGRTHTISKRHSIEGMPLDKRIEYISKGIYKALGKYKEFIKVIRSKEDLDNYLLNACDKVELAFDTETNNSLDPLTCKLMGMCLYIPNYYPAYVPVNHCKLGTDELLEGQLTEEEIRDSFQVLKEKKIPVIMHNGKFDIRVMRNTCNIEMPIYWDTMIAAQLLDENESARLKYQFKKYVDPTIDVYNIETFFAGIPYKWVPIDVFALYAAIDAYDTYLLYKEQKEAFSKKTMEKLYKLFFEVEMPIVTITSKMEDVGICMDIDYLNKLDKKYKQGLEAASKEIEESLSDYKLEIRHYQNIGKLSDPINFESSQQLSLILYDILKTPVSDSGKKSTDKATLSSLDLPFTKALLKYRQYSILIKTFTTPIPEYISKKDGKLHAHFNQMGREDSNVVTGRFSSTQPNLQQIPSKETSMRLMFKASPGYAIVGGDFSAQEPRLMCQLSGDKKFHDIFDKDLDPYASISSLIFHKDYWECMEHTKDGKDNQSGKKLRKKAKTILLGICYGMGSHRLASNLGVSVDEARDILNEFYREFASVKDFTDMNLLNSKTIGYVEDYLGRRRRLPDANLSEIEIRAKKKVFTNLDDFPDSSNKDSDFILIDDLETNSIWSKKYKENFENKGFNAKNEFKELAKKNNISIFDNGAFIGRTQTQCTNARIQGSAATLTKKAMIAIDRDEILNKLGFRILVPVHDEILGECPLENAKEVEKRLSYVMVNAGKPECTVKMKTDTYIVKHWYADELSNKLYKEYNDIIKNGSTEEEALLKIGKSYPEVSENILRDMCLGNYDPATGGV